MNVSSIARLHRLLLAAALSACLAGCSPLRILNALVPESGFEASRDIAYGTHPRHQLDVYRSVSATAGTPSTPKPVVVFFYGGAWEDGEKGGFLFVAEALTSRGYVVVMPDYRLYPEVIFPAYMEDAAQAVKWTFDHVADYGGDPSRVFVMGHSAGAQLAALIAFDGKYLARVGLDKQHLRGMVSLAGPLDFLPLTEPNLFFIFPQSVRAASQPINFVSGTEAPALLLHGEADTRVGIHNSRHFAARISQRGGAVETTYYPGMSHVGILLALAAPLRQGEPVLDRVAKFIDAQAATPDRRSQRPLPLPPWQSTPQRDVMPINTQ